MNRVQVKFIFRFSNRPTVINRYPYQVSSCACRSTWAEPDHARRHSCQGQRQDRTTGDHLKVSNIFPNPIVSFLVSTDTESVLTAARHVLGLSLLEDTESIVHVERPWEGDAVCIGMRRAIVDIDVLITRDVLLL